MKLKIHWEYLEFPYMSKTRGMAYNIGKCDRGYWTCLIFSQAQYMGVDQFSPHLIAGEGYLHNSSYHIRQIHSRLPDQLWKIGKSNLRAIFTRHLPKKQPFLVALASSAGGLTIASQRTGTWLYPPLLTARLEIKGSGFPPDTEDTLETNLPRIITGFKSRYSYQQLPKSPHTSPMLSFSQNPTFDCTELEVGYYTFFPDKKPWYCPLIRYRSGKSI